MTAKHLIRLFFPVLFFSSTAFAYQLTCEIYDLATADILAHSGPIQLKSEDLRNAVPYKLKLEHVLMNADFQLSFVDVNSTTLLFQIKTYEVVNSEYGKFLTETSLLKPGKRYELGRVFTEITGYGDNTMSYCTLIIESNP